MAKQYHVPGTCCLGLLPLSIHDPAAGHTITTHSTTRTNDEIKELLINLCDMIMVSALVKNMVSAPLSQARIQDADSLRPSSTPHLESPKLCLSCRVGVFEQHLHLFLVETMHQLR